MLTLTAAQMKQAERLADAGGLSYEQMMENAGGTAYQYLDARYDLPNKQCVILAGSGNNGGDGFVIARRLIQDGGAPVVILCAGKPQTELALLNCGRVLELGGRIIDPADGLDQAFHFLLGAQVIIDAVFGTGFHGEVPSPAAELLDCANSTHATRVALDVPSGMNADTGLSGEICFQADVTLSFAAYKPAHASLTSRPGCGVVEVLDIGIPADIIFSVYNRVTPITVELICSLLPPRAPDSHKGSYGRLLCLAGSRGMGGAAMMCALAALRMGAGLVTLAAPKAVAETAAPHLMEATTLPLPETPAGAAGTAAIPLLEEAVSKATACAAGCGLSTGAETRELLFALMKTADCPLLLDADALNGVSADPASLDCLRKTPVLTPHPGEMGRLVDMTAAQVTENAISVAKLFAREHRAVVVLKGHRTLVATPEGEVFRNTSGNAGLAKGGSGDVLAGMVGALLAQGRSARDAAVCGVFLHGMAADSLAGRMSLYSMLARDIIDELPFVLKGLGF